MRAPSRRSSVSSRAKAGQNPTHALTSGGTRVPRVVFGVPPKTPDVRASNWQPYSSGLRAPTVRAGRPNRPARRGCHPKAQRARHGWVIGRWITGASPGRGKSSIWQVKNGMRPDGAGQCHEAGRVFGVLSLMWRAFAWFVAEKLSRHSGFIGNSSAMVGVSSSTGFTCYQQYRCLSCQDGLYSASFSHCSQSISMLARRSVNNCIFPFLDSNRSTFCISPMRCFRERRAKDLSTG